MKILIAVSGGADSVVLLDLLAKKKLAKFLGSQQPETRNQQLAIAHFNHGIHKQAKVHEKFVEALAKQYDLEIFVGKAKQKLKNEAEARDARYAFLEKVAKSENCDRIALAHHADDQIETIFLNLIRGSGLTGLAGMAETAGCKWRPLLGIPKSKIADFAKKQKLKFVVDPTNSDEKFTRNFLRRDILPRIGKLNPKYQMAILRFAKIGRENLELISLLAQEWLLRFTQKKSIALAAFSALPNALKREVIRMIYLTAVGDLRGIEEKHIEEVLELAGNPAGGKKKKLGKLEFRTAKQGGVRVFSWK
jgi:tRNA(Ile)-lysidine synthetase-like protein